MSNEWDAFAETWDSLAFEYAEKAFEELKKCSDLNGLRIFDFGCGTGLLSERMAPYAKEIVALDNSQKMTLALKQKRIAGVTVITDLLTPNLINNTPELQKHFDLIVASSVCSFLPNYKEIINLISTMLNPRGIFVQWDWLKVNDHSEDGLSKKEVYDVLSASGLADVTISIPFEISSPEGVMPVLMATGKKNKSKPKRTILL